MSSRLHANGKFFLEIFFKETRSLMQTFSHLTMFRVKSILKHLSVFLTLYIYTSAFLVSLYTYTYIENI